MTLPAMYEERSEMSTQTVDIGAPLVWPARPPDGQTVALITDKLQGHTTAANWLPADIWPELDELRAEQLRLRGIVAADIDAWHALAAEFKTEDTNYDAELRQAYRDSFAPPADTRTPEAERTARLRGVEDRLWVGARVFAEHADLVVQTIRENEPRWLADLRSRAAQADEKVREAQRLADEAKAASWHVAQLGRWVQNEAESGAFARQPAPDGTTPRPAMVSDDVIDDALARPWHRQIQVPSPAPAIQALEGAPGLESDDVDHGSDLIEPLGPTPPDATTEPVARGRFRMPEPRRRSAR